MKNFSEIENNLVTSKDSLIESFTIDSGLPKEVVTKLYESYGPNANDKFKELLHVGITSFADSMKTLLDILKNSTKEAINDLLLNLLNNTAQNDSMSFFKIITYILFMKDSANFNKLAKDFNIDEKIAGFLNNKTTNLFESIGINNELFDTEGKLKTDIVVPKIVGVNDGCDIKTEVQFYTDLRTILARNNKRWGHNWHLDNAYTAICKYIDSEIEYLINKDNIKTVDEGFEDTLIRQLIQGELNVMYRDINTLRPLISDIQTLNFDMMCLIMSFIKTNSEYCKYISRKSFDEFLDAFKMLYSKISSSRKNSLVLLPYKEGQKFQTNSIEIMEQVFIDCNKYDLYLQPLKIQSVVDMIYIMKSSSVDFNLQIRPYIRNFITKAFEVVGKLEHVLLEAHKINKYKTF